MNSKEKEYQDVIVKEPDLVFSELNEDQVTALRNPRNLNLIRIIHFNEPLTVNEMVREYEKVAGEDAKSESTVYRILKELEKLDLIMECGKRVSEGKVLTKNLYSLRARFIILDETEVEWKEESGREKLRELIKILNIVYPGLKIDKESLFQWQLHFQRLVDEDKQKLVNTKDHEILELISIWSPFNIADLIEFIGIYSVIIKDKAMQKKFLACFTKKTPSENTHQNNKINARRDLKRHGDGYQDLIRHRSDILCEMKADDPRASYFTNPIYRPIIKALYNKPMTVEEIVTAYADYTHEVRKPSTIYKYLKVLKEEGIVKEMGQRVYHDRKAVQRIYGLVARLFHFHSKDSLSFRSEKRTWLIDATIKIFKYLYPHLPMADREKVRKLAIYTTECNTEGMRKLDAPENSKALELFHEYSWKDFYLVMTTYLDYNFYLNRPDIHERIMDCFITKK
ncbi:MAG: helix-turn-helix domain-containing protein [Candidatus Hodarchaeales archaeon]